MSETNKTIGQGTGGMRNEERGTVEKGTRNVKRGSATSQRKPKIGQKIKVAQGEDRLCGVHFWIICCEALNFNFKQNVLYMY